MSLWENVADVESIADLIDALDRRDELTPELAEQLQHALIKAIAGTKAKVDRCASVLCTFEMAEASARAEAARLTKRADRFERQREHLEANVLAVLSASQLDKLEGETSTLSRRKNPPKVVIDCEAAVPFEFMAFPEQPPPPPPVPDRKLIAAALKAKRAVGGCRLEQGVRLVRS
jgi:Siphovirus Gp157